MTSSAWPLARRGRCGPCTALMTKKVEEGRRRCAYLCSGVQVRRPAVPSLSYLPLVALVLVLKAGPSCGDHASGARFLATRGGVLPACR